MCRIKYVYFIFFMLAGFLWGLSGNYWTAVMKSSWFCISGSAKESKINKAYLWSYDAYMEFSANRNTIPNYKHVWNYKSYVKTDLNRFGKRESSISAIAERQYGYFYRDGVWCTLRYNKSNIVIFVNDRRYKFIKYAENGHSNSVAVGYNCSFPPNCIVVKFYDFEKQDTIDVLLEKNMF